MDYIMTVKKNSQTLCGPIQLSDCAPVFGPHSGPYGWSKGTIAQIGQGAVASSGYLAYTRSLGSRPCASNANGGTNHGSLLTPQPKGIA